MDPLAVVLTSPPEIGLEIADLSIIIDITRLSNRSIENCKTEFHYTSSCEIDNKSGLFLIFQAWSKILKYMYWLILAQITFG